MRTVWFVLSLLFLAACAPALTTDQQVTTDQQEFKALCEKNDGEWMLMEPMKNGEMVSEKKCWGCMADMNNMICTMDEYQAWLSERQSSEGMQEMPQDMSSME